MGALDHEFLFTCLSPQFILVISNTHENKEGWG